MDPKQIRVGIAPIGWTNDDLPELGGEISFEQCIREMAEAGYEGCEVGNKFPRDPAVLKQQLAVHHLQICNQWFSYALTTTPLAQNLSRFERHLDFLQAMGATIVGGGETGNSCQGAMDVPVFEGKGMLDTAEDWKKYCDGLNRLGEAARARGMRLAFHHHMGSAIQSMAETEQLMKGTDPALVWLNYDCGHFAFAGDDPVAALRQFLPRVAHIHLKDIRQPILQRTKSERWSFLRAVQAGVFTVPGDPEGSIAFDDIFEVLRGSDYSGWMVIEAEQDPAKAPPFAYAKMARTFLRNKLGI